MIKRVQLKSRAPILSMRVYSSGEIVFNAELSRRMQLKEGDRVSLFKDDTSSWPEIYIAKIECGDCVATKMNACNAFRIYSKEYAEMLLNGIDKGMYRIGSSIFKDEAELFCVIYKKNYHDKRD